MIYILPTFQIVREFKQHANLFHFYHDGIKGVIRDIVLFSAAWELEYNAHKFGSVSITASFILDKILKEYACTPEAIKNSYEDNIDMEAYVELIATMLDKAISEMMKGLFLNAVYDVSKSYYNWQGDDLLVKIDYLKYGLNSNDLKMLKRFDYINKE